MSLESSIRIALLFLGAYAAVFGPAWLVVVPMVLISMRYRAIEVILLGLFTDFLWLPALHLPFFLVAAVVIVWALEPLRKELMIS